MTDFNKFFATIYRWIAVGFLLGIFIIAFCYAFLVAFFVVSSSWIGPLVLSPSQERVLSFQPQIVTLQSNLNKQKIELDAAKKTTDAIETQISEIETLSTRINGAIGTESQQLERTSKAINSALVAKRQNVKATEAAVAEARELLKQTEAELAAKLITSDQAAQRRIALQSAINAATDARMQVIQLEQQAEQLKQGSSTLTGGSTSIAAISSIKQTVDIKTLLAQLKIQLETAKSSVIALESSIGETERVLEVAKKSPYHRALTETVNVAFVPYENLDSVQTGMKVYDCYLKIIICYQVGKIIQIYDAEEYAKHPLFKTDMRGRLVELNLKSADAGESQILFVGSKPLLF